MSMCDRCGSNDMVRWMGSEDLCWDCRQDTLWSDDIVNEYLDSFIEAHKAEYVTWLFKPDSSQWQEPLAPLMTREEVLEMRLMYYPVWRENHHGDREWRMDFAKADGGDAWERYVMEEINGEKLLQPA